MSLLNKFAGNLRQPLQLVKGMLNDYISLDSDSKQLILKQKTVLLLCQQAVSRVEQIKSLQPDEHEGLIAEIEANKIQAKLHFVPEKITLYQDYLQGEIRLLNSPKFASNSIMYRSLIAGWQIFLGGKIPHGVLPDEVTIKKNKIYYNFPRQQLKLLDALFHSLESESALLMDMKEGELIINSSVNLNWSDLKLQSLLQFLQRK